MRSSPDCGWLRAAACARAERARPPTLRVEAARSRTPPSAFGRPGSSRAFTLVELAVVLLIISTFTALVLPAITQAMQARNVDATAAKLCETLQFAYASALARRQPVTVRFDQETHRCRVLLPAVPLPWLETPADRPQVRTLTAISWPEEMELTILETPSGQTSPSGAQPSPAGAQPLPAAAPSAAEMQAITFRSNGRTEDVAIELTDKEGQRRYVEIAGMTGQVRISENLTEEKAPSAGGAVAPRPGLQ